MLNIVTIGGGNGQAITLRALKTLKTDGASFCITALVSVADSGGSSGILRREYGILPPGDLLRASIALSDYDFATLKDLFYTQRFEDSLHENLRGHNIGNLLIKQLCESTGSMDAALDELNSLWRLHGTILPFTLDQVELCAELENGDIVRGEADISTPNYAPSIKKKRIWLEPESSLIPRARNILLSADYIILGPGDLFTSILPGLLMRDTFDAIEESRARLIFVPSLANRLCGETTDFTAADHVRELCTHLPRPCDVVIAHDGAKPKRQSSYDANGWQWMARDEEDAGVPVVRVNLEHDERAGMDYIKLKNTLEAILI